MPMKKHKPEQIVALLRQMEVEIANGKSTPQACEGSRDHCSDVLPLEERVRRPEAGSSKTDEGAGAREREVKAFSSGAVSGEADLEGRGLGKLLSPERRRCAVEHAREKYEVSERHACRLLGQWRRTQRYAAIQRVDEEALTEAIIALASEYGRYGYRRVTALLQRDGWQVGKDRVQRIWRREGLQVPQKQRPRRRLWLNDGSCIRLRPERANHVWSYDFVNGRTHDGRTIRMLTLIDEYTRECLAIRVARRLGRYRGDRSAGGCDAVPGNPGKHSLGQWPGVRCGRTAEVAGEGGYRRAVHRARKSLGERVLRKFQREAAGRVPEWRDFLFAEGGADRDREMAGAVQHEAATQRARLQAACPRGL